jgi:triacylglycerol lipase
MPAMKEGSPQQPSPPLVLVHGLLDTSRVFDRLKQALGQHRQPLLIPDLPLRLGSTPVLEAAELLGIHIEAAFGLEQRIQLLGGHRRTRRFTSVGSPQQGTLTARPWPRRLLAGIADLRPQSPLLERLNGDLELLQRIECCSFYSAIDLAVLPGWRAVLPVGPRRMLPVLTHPQLLRDPAAIGPLAEELLRP